MNMEKEISKISVSLGSVQKSIGVLGAQIGALDARIGNLNRQVVSIDSPLAALGERMSGLERHSRTFATRDDLKKLATKDDIKGLEDQIDSLAIAVSNQFNKVDGRFDDLELKIHLMDDRLTNQLDNILLNYAKREELVILDKQVQKLEKAVFV